MKRHRNPLTAVIVSVLLALLFSIMPLAEPMLLWRPEWLLLVVIFWALHAPRWIGVWMALWLGLLLDIVMGTPLALHATGMVVAVHLAGMTQSWGGIHSLRATTLLVLGLVAVARLVQFGLQWWIDPGVSFWVLWPGVLASALVWPALMLMLRQWSQR